MPCPNDPDRVATDAHAGQPRGAACPDSATAWTVVAAAFFASAVPFGVIYSFGVFLQPLAADFGVGTTSVSAFFSLTGVVYYVLGAPAGRIADRYGPRTIVTIGSAIFATGLCLTAAADNIRFACLAFAIGVGVGGACCYIPTLAAVGGWFIRRRNLALGIAAAGTGAGTLAIPPIAAALIAHYGWRTSFTVLGIACAAILLLCALAVRKAPVPNAQKTMGPRFGELLRSRAFLMLYLSWVLATMALFVPFIFLPAYAREHGAGEVAAAALVSTIGGTSIVGRLVLGPLGDRLGVVLLFKVTVLAMAASYSLWLLAGYNWLVLFAVVLGTSYGSRIAAVPVVLIELFGLENLGATLGIFFTATGIAALVGPALAGLAVELSGGYGGAILFALATGSLGFVAIVPLRGKRD